MGQRPRRGILSSGKLDEQPEASGRPQPRVDASPCRLRVRPRNTRVLGLEGEKSVSPRHAESQLFCLGADKCLAIRGLWTLDLPATFANRERFRRAYAAPAGAHAGSRESGMAAVLPPAWSGRAASAGPRRQRRGFPVAARHRACEAFGSDGTFGSPARGWSGVGSRRCYVEDL